MNTNSNKNSSIEFYIRPMEHEDIDRVAQFIAKGYYSDQFFHWVVQDSHDRQRVVADYYKVYLSAPGAIIHVAETPMKNIVGATVWLPHDVDAGIYDTIRQVAGKYAPQFDAVADKSHYSEPVGTPFYQLVGFTVEKNYQGLNIGSTLLKHQLDILDKWGVPTYLEASTPYFGRGVYGRFGYQPVGDVMHFTKEAKLYPLWRPVKGQIFDFEGLAEQNYEAEDILPPVETIQFSQRDFLVLAREDDRVLLLSDTVIPQVYHHKFENITWETSQARQFLNNQWLHTFTAEEQEKICPVTLFPDNMYFFNKHSNQTEDKIFLPSLAEIFTAFGWMGDSPSHNPDDIFHISDGFNSSRVAKDASGTPARWALRDPGSQGHLTATVTGEGKVAIAGDFVNRQTNPLFNVGLRPAFWAKL